MKGTASTRQEKGLEGSGLRIPPTPVDDPVLWCSDITYSNNLTCPESLGTLGFRVCDYISFLLLL